MNAEFAHRRVDRHHFGGEIGRDVQFLLRGQNIEFARIEDQPLVRARIKRLPKILGRVSADAIDIDKVRMFLRPIANDVGTETFGAERDAHDESITEIELAIDQRRCAMAFAQIAIVDAKFRS
jgi:hypothetical protein